MHKILADILRRKRREVALAKTFLPLQQLVREAEGFTHKSQFRLRLENASDRGAIIAEIKVASPTYPNLGVLADASARARIYERAGADGISFITEKHYFKTDLGDLAGVQAATTLPVLQKDFVIDEYQIYASHQAGVDALLLIAGLVEAPLLRRFVAIAQKLGIEPVVEVNTSDDLEQAVSTDTAIIAVNARDLKTFNVDKLQACNLIEHVPKRYLTLGFSGVKSYEDVRR